MQMSQLRKVKLITFDAYNTLFKPKGSVSAQYVEEAKKYGIKVTRDQVSVNFGKSYRLQQLKAPFYGIKQGMTPYIWWKELVHSTFLSAGVSSKVLDSNFDRMFDGIYNRFTTAEAYSIFPDVLKTLKELEQNGFKMGVISNSDERVVKIIENLKLNKYFDFILASSIVGYEKPNKAIFDQALLLSGNIPAESAFHVGDDVEKDYFGAQRAKWNSVLVARSKLSYEDFSPAMVEDTSIPLYRPKRILSLRDLYPYVKALDISSKQ